MRKGGEFYKTVKEYAKRAEVRALRSAYMLCQCTRFAYASNGPQTSFRATLTDPGKRSTCSRQDTQSL